MAYLTILFISPLYFALRGQWGAFTLNAILYGCAVLCLITLIGAPIAPFFWLIAMGHAMWHLRKEMVHEHAELLATKMAEKMKAKEI